MRALLRVEDKVEQHLAVLDAPAVPILIPTSLGSSWTRRRRTHFFIQFDDNGMSRARNTKLGRVESGWSGTRLPHLAKLGVLRSG